MSYGTWALAAKLGLDAVATIDALAQKNWVMAYQFSVYVLFDLGAIWLLFKTTGVSV